MAVEIQSLHIVVPAFVGLAIGILEAYFVYEDEGSAGLNGFFAKVWHGILFSIFGVLIATNVPYIISMGWIPSFLEGLLMINENGVSLVICALIAIIMFVKIDMAHRMKGVSGNGFIEKPWHKLIVAVLIGFAPYYIFMIYGQLTFLSDIVPWLPL